MLELIVLGEVPGTNVVISYPLALAMVTFFVEIILLIQAHRLAEKPKSPRIDEITL